ncbi:MAG: FeoA family protein [Bacteroidota bacterium]
MQTFHTDTSPTNPGENRITLKSLSLGERAKIVSITSNPLSLELSKFGICIGNIIQVTEIAPLGDPIAITTKGTKISLRKKDASCVWIAKL